jgi:hypothetical protein
MTVTVDSTAHLADATWPSADGHLPTNIIQAEIVEPVGGQVTADTVRYTADNTIYPTADGGVLPGASDVLDATVIAGEIEIPVGGGGYYPRPKPFPVEGVGFGILPEVRGEAFGVVVVAGVGVGALPDLNGEATGTVGAVGRSAARLIVRAASIGIRGQAGTANAVLNGLSIASTGAVGAHGSGSGVIMKFKATAIGRHDDDEAAVMAFLLAA